MTEFIGINALKEKMKAQNEQFKVWAKTKSFHHSHYDWWAFPINQKSGYGLKYTLDQDAIQKLLQDELFISVLRSNAKLLLLSWGWLIDEERLVEDATSDQRWQNYPVRLYKCVLSLKIFGQTDYLQSIKKFVQYLGYGPNKALNTNDKDAVRVIRTLEMPGYEQYSDPGLRYT